MKSRTVMTELMSHRKRVGVVLLAGLALLAAPACAEEQPRPGVETTQEVRGGEAQPRQQRSVRDATPRREVSPEIQESLSHARALSQAFQHAAQTIDPSVVHIIQQREVRVMRGFFDMGERQLRPTGTGSGFIVTPDGYIVTNHHVIAGAERVQVRLNDGREYDGRIVGTDPLTDLGVVKIEADNLVSARFGDSEALEVGEWVLAVGSPFGVFNNTVTAGIVSAKGRRGLAGPGDSFEDFIQTDAAINPGNSGGPLVNLEGEVIGINSQIATRTGGSVGIGFAIPSAIAAFVVDSIINTGRVERGWLGVEGPMGQGLTRQQIEMFERAGAEPGAGALIAGVIPGGPADRGGLEPGDIVVRFNGRPTPDYARFRNAVAFTAPGTPVELEVLRDGERVRLETVVTDTTRGRALLPGGAAYPRYGFTAVDLPAQAARQFGIQGGVVVTEIEQLGPAAQADLRQGDVVVHVNGEPVRHVEAFDAVIRGTPAGEPIRVGVIRPATRQRGYIDIQPRE